MGLNDREIASLIWLGIALLVCILHPSIRPALGGVAKALFQRQIVVVVALLYAYLGLTVWFLHLIGLWDWDQLKNVFLWSLAVGFASLFRISSIADEPHFFRTWLADNLKVIVVVEYFVSFYALPLLAEFLMVPVLFMIVGMVVIGEREPRHRSVVTLLNGLLSLFGLFLLVHAAYNAIADFEGFATMATLRDFYTPIVLSILFVPFIFVMHIYMSYETAFAALPFAINDTRLRRYAKLLVIFAFGPDVELLRRWRRHVGAHHPDDRDDIRRSITETKIGRRRERHPNVVPSDQGWSPNNAKDFLSGIELGTSDYRRQFGEWFANSQPLEIGEGLFPDNLAYNVEGDELVAMRLNLKVNINDPSMPQMSEKRFREAGHILLSKALGEHRISLDRDQFDIRIGPHRISLIKTVWAGGIPGGYDRKLTVEVISPMVDR